MSDTLLATPIYAAYHALLDEGRIVPDVAQETLVEQLAKIQQQWIKKQPSAGLLSRLLGNNDAPDTLQGIYLWGDVGRGKSLLMDMFFDSTPFTQKRRVHYHAFMMDVHARIHTWRQKNRDDAAVKDPLPPLAAALAEEAKLLCLDELQVTDIADAMILGRLFRILFENGVKVVFTTNRKPDDLYLHGLQREMFLPFIALIHEKLAVLELASHEDYRLKQLKAMQEVFMVAPAAQARSRMDVAFAQLTHEANIEEKIINVQGHSLHVPQFYGDVARFSFEGLCAKALGAADYEAIAQEFTTVLLDDIPLLTPEKRNEAKRFVTLIDTLYEHKVKLICSAAAAPDALYPKGDGSFEFARTASRLIEMQSETYLAASHNLT
ncbi:MAG: AFG1 family ATPase [Alphaproteobacteria bacterium]|nr:AFG1 family ATPase [Alphaproteobacteria bacterium]